MGEDKEVVAMMKCAKLLGELDSEERVRALDWLNGKFGIRTMLASADTVEVYGPIQFKPVELAEGVRVGGVSFEGATVKR